MTLGGLYQNTLLRFLVVGGCLALLYSILAALATTYLPVPKPLSAAGTWVFCIPLGFWCQRHFTFATSTPRRHALWLYGATQVLGVCIAATATHFLARGVFWPDLFVHLGASAFVAIISYLFNRLVIFRNPGGSDGS
jgi:putative flippase GtrA